MPAYVKMTQIEILLAPTVNFDRDLFRQFLTQVVDVNARPAIDVGWVLPCEECDSQLCLQVESKIKAFFRDYVLSLCISQKF